jgi:septum formation protein
MYQLILASQSPRRKELLGWLGIPFTIQPADVDEEVLEAEKARPEVFVRRLAELKASHVLKSSRDSNPLVVASDTTVVLDQKILNKPATVDEAREMLMTLSDREHTVFTAVSIQTRQKQYTFCVQTQVEFSKITPDILEPYLQTRDSLDKAGAYGIQGMGLTFVKGVRGSYSNVVGFPLVEFIEELRAFVCPDEVRRREWRSHFIGGDSGQRS